MTNSFYDLNPLKVQLLGSIFNLWEGRGIAESLSLSHIFYYKISKRELIAHLSLEFKRVRISILGVGEVSKTWLI